MPPCGQVTPVGSVSHGTTDSPAQRTAAGCTGALSVGNCTQGASAQTTTTQHHSLNQKFNPLPLSVVSPINVDVLEKFLKHYPCPGSRDYLVSGFRNGFDIGFRGTFDDPNSRPPNLLSARNNAEQVTEAIAKELSRGHTSGPFPHPFHGSCHPLSSSAFHTHPLLAHWLCS